MTSPTDPSGPDPRFPGGNYLDWLMHLDPLELSAQNIDEIILIQRKQRLAWESGVKPKKSAGPPIDLGKLGLAQKEEPIKRRKI